MITQGSFVAHKTDTTHELVGIVTVDHVWYGFPDLVSIKWMVGGISNREKDDLVELTPMQFCKAWAKEFGYPEGEQL